MHAPGCHAGTAQGLGEHLDGRCDFGAHLCGGRGRCLRFHAGGHPRRLGCRGPVHPARQRREARLVGKHTAQAEAAQLPLPPRGEGHQPGHRNVRGVELRRQDDRQGAVSVSCQGDMPVRGSELPQRDGGLGRRHEPEDVRARVHLRRHLGAQGLGGLRPGERPAPERAVLSGSPPSHGLDIFLRNAGWHRLWHDLLARLQRRLRCRMHGHRCRHLLPGRHDGDHTAGPAAPPRGRPCREAVTPRDAVHGLRRDERLRHDGRLGL
mmetsp:Transcript_107632/g.335620  ORF Transcript_107632/g.335620 Transcript_107632/m.335620 type:complete len:265 (+) Transcript_107632:286-1080(+)